MSDPDPELAHPEAAGWVLGTLDPDDAEWFAGHLPSCPDCRAAVAEFAPTARLMATAAPADLPPADLQARTLAAVSQAAADAQRSSRWRGLSTRILALAATVIVAAGVSLGFLLSRGPVAPSYALALHSGAGLSASASGTVHQTDSGWSVKLTEVDLPPTGPGHFYQCWWIVPGNEPGTTHLVSAGTFTVSASGTATVQMSSAANPDNVTAVEVTLDSASQQPGPVILSGTVGND